MTVAAAVAPWTFEWGDTTGAEVVAALSETIAVNEIDFAAFQAASAPLHESATFVDVIGADMIAALGIE